MNSPRLKILVVDDEPLARDRLKNQLSDLGIGDVVGEAGDGHDAIIAVQNTEAQVVLMDIRMPGMDGLEAARHLGQLPTPPAIIFTTAFDAHALEAFEANAVDYLLKPIRAERLNKALEKVRTLNPSQIQVLESLRDTANIRSHLSVTLQGNLKLLPVKEVRYFRAEHKYVTARHPQGELVMDEPLGSLEEEFSGEFIRVHRNALAARAHIRGLQKADGGHCLVFDGIDDQLEVSRRLLAKVRKLLR